MATLVMFQGNAAEVIGRRVGNYVVERTLAQGGMGSVFVARHPTLGREAAVKFLGHDLEAPPELTKRFLDEARITANLRHPNIVDIFDFGELDGRLYYVMELLEGCDLSRELKHRGHFSSSETLEVLTQISEGLAAAHTVGVVHRDLKPANVFVLSGDPLRVKLMDFGIAKVLSSASEHTSYGQIMGTPRYMSPEQALGQVDRISPRSDLYSLGVIAYEMLTGVAPFEHESPVMLLVMHVRDAFRPIIELVPDCPLELAQLVEGCLAKDPEGRPASAGELLERLSGMRRRSGTHPKLRENDRLDAGEPVLALLRRADIGEDDTLRGPDLPSVEVEIQNLPGARITPTPPPKDAGARAPAVDLRSAPSPLSAAESVGARHDEATPIALPAESSVEPIRIPVGATSTRDAPPATVHLTETDKNVLNRLLLRMQRKGDFPAFVQNVGEVSKRADFESSFSAQQLGASILKDYALTAKLLRIVNSAYASRFGGKIYSVQHAIVILGFERVRQLALSISLFKNQGNKVHSERVSESAINSLVSGEIARQLYLDVDLDDAEQAVICTMFRNLGRHLVLVYLPESFDQIEALMVQENLSLNTASERVLGISLHKLGVGIAERWRLPQRMIQAMAVIPERSGKLHREEDRLSSLAAFSNQLCEIVGSDLDTVSRNQALNTLTSKYKHLISIKTEEMTELLGKVQESFEQRYHSLLGNSTKTSRFSRNVSQLIEDAAVILEATLEPASEARDVEHSPSSSLPPPAPPAPSGNARRPRDRHETAKESEKPVHSSKPRRPVERVQLAKVNVSASELEGDPFAQRISALRKGLEQNGPSDALLTSLLTTIQSMLDLPRLFVLRSSANHRELYCPCGVGEDIDGLSKELRLPLAPARAATNPFSMTYHVNRTLFIEDCFAQENRDDDAGSVLRANRLDVAPSRPCSTEKRWRMCAGRRLQSPSFDAQLGDAEDPCVNQGHSRAIGLCPDPDTELRRLRLVRLRSLAHHRERMLARRSR
ncbi:MAG: protein kinase [Polyangiaceae bacterium]